MPLFSILCPVSEQLHAPLNEEHLNESEPICVFISRLAAAASVLNGSAALWTF